MSTPPTPQDTGQPRPRPRALLWPLVAGLVVSLAMMVLLALRLLPTGIPGQWEWPWRDSDFVASPMVAVVVAAHLLALAVVLGLVRQARLRRGMIALALIVCCLAALVSIAVLETSQPGWPLHVSLSTASVPATGYFGYATVVQSVSEVLTSMSARGTAAMPPRVLTHPPGPVLFYYAGLRALERWPALTDRLDAWLYMRYHVTAEMFATLARYISVPGMDARHFAPALLLGLLLTLLGALLPIPAYFVALRLHGPRAGLLAALLAATVPSLSVFCPSIDGLGAVLAMTALALWLWALQADCTWRHALAGVATAAAAFWSVGLLAVAVPMAAAAWPGLRAQATRSRTLGALIIAAGTFAGVFVMLYFAGGYSLPANIRTIVTWQSLDVAHSKRAYGPWLGANLYDVLVFMGPALVGAVVAGLSGLSGRRAVAAYAMVGAVVALGVVWISGSTLGEVGRIWLFLMGLLVPVGAVGLADLPPGLQNRVLGLIVLSQACLTVLLHSRLLLVSP